MKVTLARLILKNRKQKKKLNGTKTIYVLRSPLQLLFKGKILVSKINFLRVKKVSVILNCPKAIWKNYAV